MSDIETVRRVYLLEQQMRAIRDPDRNPLEFESIQTRADSVAAKFGDRVPPPAIGELALAYRKRLLSKFQKYSPGFEKTPFHAYDAATIETLENRIYSDAAEAAANQHNATPGVLVPYTERVGGREITKFYGDVGAFLAPFTAAGQSVKIVKP